MGVGVANPEPDVGALRRGFRPRPRAPEKHLGPALDLDGHFVEAVRHPCNIALSKGAVSEVYRREYLGEQIKISDKVFLLGVLKAGEYTKPKALKDSGAGQLNVHTDGLFACQRDIKEIYNGQLSSTGEHFLCSTYFKPHPWSPVKRIEFHRRLLASGEAGFRRMLSTVSKSMKIPTILEPLEQFVVDQIVKQHTARMPALYQTVGIASIQRYSNDLALQLVGQMRT